MARGVSELPIRNHELKVAKRISDIVRNAAEGAETWRAPQICPKSEGQRTTMPNRRLAGSSGQTWLNSGQAEALSGTMTSKNMPITIAIGVPNRKGAAVAK